MLLVPLLAENLQTSHTYLGSNFEKILASVHNEFRLTPQAIKIVAPGRSDLPNVKITRKEEEIGICFDLVLISQLIIENIFLGKFLFSRKVLLQMFFLMTRETLLLKNHEKRTVLFSFRNLN